MRILDRIRTVDTDTDAMHTGLSLSPKNGLQSELDIDVRTSKKLLIALTEPNTFLLLALDQMATVIPGGSCIVRYDGFGDLAVEFSEEVIRAR